MIINSFGQYLLHSLPFMSYRIKKDELFIKGNKSYLFLFLFFLKNHTNCQFKILTDLVVVDYPNQQQRFEIIYCLLSIQWNVRIALKISINEMDRIPTVSSLYSNATWCEREIWDMFGIFFSGHPDLRRILTDYGFEGYPLRKDFPLSGYKEIFYNECKKRIDYKPVFLQQTYRKFTFHNPWVL